MNAVKYLLKSKFIDEMKPMIFLVFQASYLYFLKVGEGKEMTLVPIV